MVARKSIRRLLLLLASAILLVTTLVVLPSMHFNHIDEAQKRVSHSLLVLNSSEDVLSATESAETSERGYILTGDPRYLAPFQTASSQQAQFRKELQQLTVDNASQQTRMAQLNRLLDFRFSELERIIQLYQNQGQAQAIAAVKNSQGSQIMTQIRDTISAIQQEERRLLKLRNGVVDREAAILNRTLHAGGAVLAVLLAIFALVSESDISAHKNAEELAKEREQQFLTLANAIPQLCWMAKPDGAIFWYNQRWFEFTGKTHEQMMGWGWQSLHDPKILPLVMQRWQASIQQGEPFEMVFPLLAASGSFHSFLTRVVPLRDENGKVIRWFGTNTDISSQLAIEDALRESQERLRLAHAVAQIGTFERNLATNQERCTPELEAIYAQQPGSFARQQKGWVDFVHPGHRETVRRRLVEAAETGSFEAEWPVVWQNGEERWHFGRATVVKSETSAPARLVGAIVDVTARKQAERELVRLNAELEQRVLRRTAELENANKELAAFAYSVSHDLRAPLRGIDGWSLALLEDYGDQLDATAHQYLNRVRCETQRMGNLIDDILQLSRVTREEMKLLPVDLSALAHAISTQLQFVEQGRSIDFVIQPKLCAPGDGRLLEIALTNLFSNAVKFTGKRPQARIEFGRAQMAGESAFYIRDNGAGFDMRYAGALFGAFQRLHKPSEFPGTGIGLAIVQRVIGRHSGKIWAEGEVNAGATFWFTLGANT